MVNKTKKTPSFEDALKELESLVDLMESGDMTLEDSLKSFERGVALTRTCQQALVAAEQKVEILTANTVDSATEAFTSGS